MNQMTLENQWGISHWLGSDSKPSQCATIETGPDETMQPNAENSKTS